MAKKIFQRIAEIRASASVEMMVQCGIGRCHPLEGKLKNHYAVDLKHPYRLVFKKCEKIEDIQIVKIERIIDYH